MNNKNKRSLVPSKAKSSSKQDNEFDVVVIGSGNGGLVAAATCAKYNLKTLLVEQHNLPGGFATSFIRGRFEFEPSLHELGNVGNEKVPGVVYKIFKDLGVKIKWHEVPEAFDLLVKNDDGTIESFRLPVGIEEFAKACDKIEPGCYKKVINFLDICENCYNAVYEYINPNRGIFDPKVLKSKYPNYLTVATYSISDVLKKLKMPKKIKFIIESYWFYIGVRPEEVDANLYAIMFYEYIKFGAYIPEATSHEISQAIIDRFQQLGGTVWYNTKAEKIDIKNNHVVGLKTNNGYIKAKHIISNVNPQSVYGQMMEPKDVPDICKKLYSYRGVGSQGFCIYLGLNKPIEHFKLKSYSYFVFSHLDHNKVYDNTKSIDKNLEYIFVALNNGNPKASEKGTSIVSFTTLYQDAWNNVKEEDYFKLKNKIAAKFIEDFESKFNINLKDAIEEIEIATPITFARYTGSLNGAIYGSKCDPLDSVLTRGFNMRIYEPINGLKFCGGNGFSTHGYSITYLSGSVAAGRTFQTYEEEESK